MSLGICNNRYIFICMFLEISGDESMRQKSTTTSNVHFHLKRELHGTGLVAFYSLKSYTGIGMFRVVICAICFIEFVWCEVDFEPTYI